MLSEAQRRQTAASGERGVGKVAYGEGMIGLNWALFVAGVPTTIVSQWKVEAASSTALFGTFYKALKMGLPRRKRYAKRR